MKISVQTLVMGLTAGLCLSAAPASAFTVLIDFGLSTGHAQGTTTPVTSGIYWNNVTSTAHGAPVANLSVPSELLTTAGELSGVGISLASGQWSSAGFANGGLRSANYLSTLVIDGISIEVESATEDYFFSDYNNPASLTLSGLDPSSTYTLSLWGTRAAADPARWTSYTVTDFSGSSSQNLQTSGTGAGAGGYNGNNDTLIVFENLQPAIDGTLTLAVESVNQSGDPRWGYLGVLGLTQVPEPGSAMLAGLGGLALAFRRGRRER